MSVKLEVRTAPRTGLAFTCVPGDAMWELVEYLAAQRTEVFYGYTADGFTVTFQRMSAKAAQRLLDAWAAGQFSDHAYQDAPACSEELCYLPG